jgi:hypothetical protein
MCQCRTLTHARVPPSRVLVKVRTLPGRTWGPMEGPGIPFWESQTVIKGLCCAYRGPVFLRGGPDPMTHPDVLSFLATWYP